MLNLITVGYSVAVLFMSVLCLKTIVLRKQKKILLKQLQSIQFGSGLKALLFKVQQHRGMVNALLKGDDTFKPKITVTQNEIEHELTALRKFTDNNTVYVSKLNLITTNWQRLQQDVFSMPVELSFTEHSRLIEMVLNFITTVAEQNQLMTDNSYETEYVNIIWHLIPVTTEALGKARAVGSGIAASGKSQAVDRIKLGFLISKIQIAMQQVQKRLNKVSDTDGELKQIFSNIHQDMDSFISIMENQFLLADRPVIQAGEFFDQATTLLNTVYALYDKTEAMAIHRLESATAKTDSSAMFSYGSVLVSSLLVLVSGTSYFFM